MIWSFHDVSFLELASPINYTVYFLLDFQFWRSFGTCRIDLFINSNICPNFTNFYFTKIATQRFFNKSYKIFKNFFEVCLTVLSPFPWIGAIKLLNALLENNHEGIPVPIQVFLNLFFKGFW